MINILCSSFFLFLLCFAFTNIHAYCVNIIEERTKLYHIIMLNIYVIKARKLSVQLLQKYVIAVLCYYVCDVLCFNVKYFSLCLFELPISVWMRVSSEYPVRQYL